MTNHPGRLLIVEDEELLALELQERLRRLGYDVVATAATGAEAIAAADTARPDLMLMDIRLAGGMDGIEAARIAQQRIDVPVVFLTAHSDDGTFNRAKHAVAPYGYLVKPISEPELRTTVALALHKHALERDLRRTNQVLQHKARAMEDFTSGASHDLRSPLATIRSVLGVLKDEVAFTAEQSTLVDALDQTAGRMSLLLESLLSLAQLRAPRPELVALRPAIAAVLADLGHAVESARGRVDVDVDLTITADPAQLHRLFLNLIGNALKYQRRGVSPQVIVRTVEARPGMAAIEIADNGVGLPAGYEHKLFKPFQRLHAEGTVEGSGLGLAACAKIVAQHGGVISARPATPHGAIFRVDLPIDAAHAAVA